MRTSSSCAYSGYWAKRGRRDDGVAILWSLRRFTVVQEGWNRVVFSDRLFGLVVHLNDLATKNVLLAIGAHLERNPDEKEKEKVRFEQLMEMIETARGNNTHDSVVLAGDMNSGYNTQFSECPECINLKEALDSRHLQNAPVLIPNLNAHSQKTGFVHHGQRYAVS